MIFIFPRFVHSVFLSAELSFLSEIVLLLNFLMMTLSSNACSFLLLCSHIPGCLLLSWILPYYFSCLCPSPGLLWSPSSPVHTLPSPHHLAPTQWSHSSDAPAFPLSSFFFSLFLPLFFSGLCRTASLPRLPLLAELRGSLTISTPSKLWGFSGSPHCTNSHRPGDWYCTE